MPRIYYILLFFSFSCLFAEMWDPDPSAGPISANWNDPSNWLPEIVPNSNSATATFGNIASGPLNAVLNTQIEVDTILFNSNSSYIITGSNSLEVRRIEVAANTPSTSIEAPIIFNAGSEILNNSTSTLNLNRFGGGGIVAIDGIGKVSLQGMNSDASLGVIIRSSLELTNSNNFTPTTVLATGASQVSQQIPTLFAINTISLSNTIQFEDSNISVASDSSLTLTGEAQLSGGVTKIGEGSLILSHSANTRTGDTTLQEGTLQITNSNSLGSGNLILEGGTFSTNFGGTSVTINNPIALNGTGPATISVGTNDTLVIDGAISGSSPLIKSGAGILLNSGSANNTRTGALTIAEGTVKASSVEDISSSNLIIQEGTLLTDIDITYANPVVVENTTSTIQVDAGTFTLSGRVTGAGKLNKLGNGVLVLSDDTNVFNGLNIQEGIARVNTNSLGGSLLDISNDSQLVIDSPSTLTLFSPVNFGSGGGSISNDDAVIFSSQFSGEGPITKLGAGDLTLPVNSIHTGGIDVMAGRVLMLAPSGATSGDIILADQTSYLFLNTDAILDQEITIANGAVGFGAGTSDSTVTVNGNITGAGKLSLVAGTTILSGNNSYIGTDVPTGATLGIESSAAVGSEAISLAGDLRGVADATLINDIELFSSNTFSIDDATTLTLNGAITGTSDIIKADTGTLILNDSNFTGSFTVNDGSLIVNSSASNNATTLNGGRLGGSGSFGATTVASGLVFGTGTYNSLDLTGGTIAPGNSVGVINITGNYAQASGATYAVEIDGNSSDQLLITGTASIDPGAILTVDKISGTILKGNTYDILIADGGLNQLWTVQQIDESIAATLELVNGTTARLTTSNSIVFAGRDIEAGNPTAVATYLNEIEIADDSDLLSTILIMDSLDDQGLNDALNMLHPARFAAFELSNMDDNHGAFSLFTDRLELSRSCLFENRSHSFWIAPMTMLTNVDRQQDIPGYDGVTGGLVTGYEATINDHFAVGGAASYLYSNIQWPDKKGRGNVQKGFLAAYMGYFLPRLSFDLGLLGGISGYDVRRTIAFPGLDRTAYNKHGGGFFSSHMGLDLLPWPAGKWLRLFFEIDYNYLHQDSYRETGAGCLGLNVDERDSHFLREELGVHFQNIFDKEYFCWQIDYCLSWVNKLPLNNGEYHSKLYSYSDGPDMTVKTINHSLNFFSPQIKISCQKENFSLSTGYQGEFKGHYHTHLITLDLSTSW